MSALWRYTAVGQGSPALQRGELPGTTAAEVRVSLRRIGLQVVTVRPIRSRRMPTMRPLAVVQSRIAQHLRKRRQSHRAEFYDSLATMLEAGLSLVDALDTMLDSTRTTRRTAGTRAMLLGFRESLRGGSSLADAMTTHEGWFDEVDLAMVKTAQHAGTLPVVLRSLAARQQRASDLQGRLTGALIYPAVIACVGLGVVVFLSVKTLPELTGLLTQSDVAVPALTKAVMSFGQFIAGHWLLIVTSVAAAALMAMFAPALLSALRINVPTWLINLRPVAIRRLAVARLANELAELLRSGVPFVEAMRIAGPTCPMALQAAVRRAADRMERGDEIAAALDGSVWFDAEFRRLVQIGGTSGELESILGRIAAREERRAARLIDRLASLLEPAVILSLAVLIGVVAMAAILPLVRLQEIIR